MKINLVWLGKNSTAPDWTAGDLYCIEATPRAVHACVQKYAPDPAVDAWCFWDEMLAPPVSGLLAQLLTGPADLWHAGLLLGTGGQPEFIDFVNPTWMLNCDPDSGIEATSWRMSLRCCLIRSEVLRQLGGPLPHFRTLDAAALEMGYRFIRSGVFMRHAPQLLTRPAPAAGIPVIPAEDQLRFIHVNHGRKWTLWACLRAVLTRTAGLPQLLAAYHRIQKTTGTVRKVIYQRKTTPAQVDPLARVTVLIPTINRYPYLRTLLGQLRQQTIRPHEIILVDQTPAANRDLNIASDYADLPIQILVMDDSGQCRSRNLGLQHATGDYILFIDDDDEVPETLIESHLSSLIQFQINISCGVALEDGAGPLPANYQFLRISDVFPTNNSLIRKAVLNRSGLFDLAYDRGQRADADLGTRLYLSGEMMVLNPAISLLHHHAPQGGLREHRARVHTYAASRKHVTVRTLGSVSDFYRSMRYFTPRQAHERTMLDILGTFSTRGSLLKKTVKILFGLILLPHTLWVIRSNRRKAKTMIQSYPVIPAYHFDEMKYAASDT